MASFLLDEQFQGPEYFTSTIHNQIINARIFEAFLKERCSTKDDILKTNEVRDYIPEIQLIHNGFNLWTASVLLKILEDLKLHYILQLSSFPTNNHMAERAVKLSHHCSLQKRQELMRTLCAVGNFESVKKGNKRSRDMCEKTDCRKKIPRNREIIRTKMKGNALMNDCLDEAKESLHRVNNNKNATKILASNEHQFSNDKNAAFLNLYDDHCNTVRHPTHLETRQGVMRTPLMNDQILFKRMLNPFRTDFFERQICRFEV